MKISIVAVVLGIVVFVASCQKDSDERGPYLSNFANTECGGHNDTIAAKQLGEDEEYVINVNDGVVNVTHVNWMVPCDFHDITVAFSYQSNSITINECCQGGLVNCICNIDNSFDINDLPAGTYTVFFNVCGNLNFSTTITI